MLLRNTESKLRTYAQAAISAGLNLLLGEKCLKLATLRLIADNISFLGGRLDQARIVRGGVLLLVMVRSSIGS